MLGLYPIPKEIHFPRCNMKCSGESVILRKIVHFVVCFPLHFMVYRRNFDYFSDRVGTALYVLYFCIAYIFVESKYPGSFWDRNFFFFFLCQPYYTSFRINPTLFHFISTLLYLFPYQPYSVPFCVNSITSLSVSTYSVPFCVNPIIYLYVSTLLCSILCQLYCISFRINPTLFHFMSTQLYLFPYQTYSVPFCVNPFISLSISTLLCSISCQLYNLSFRINPTLFHFVSTLLYLFP